MASTPTAVRQLLGTWAVEVDLNLDPAHAYGASNFIGLNGIKSLTRKFTNTAEDLTDYSTSGYKTYGITGKEWGLDVVVGRAKDVPTRDPGQEALKAAAEGGYPIQVRYYEKLVGGDGYYGWVVVQWEPVGGAALDMQDINITLLPASDRTSIPTPYVASAPPVINAISPATGPAAGGTLVKITGSGFTGATAVKFGTITATYQVHSDLVAYAVAPAQAASTKDVSVTTAAGVSANVAADDYVYV